MKHRQIMVEFNHITLLHLLNNRLQIYNLELFLADKPLSVWKDYPELSQMLFAIVKIQYQEKVLFEEECFLQDKKRIKNLLRKIKQDKNIQIFQKKHILYQTLESKLNILDINQNEKSLKV
jgi:hypothetical protein